MITYLYKLSILLLFFNITHTMEEQNNNKQNLVIDDLKEIKKICVTDNDILLILYQDNQNKYVASKINLNDNNEQNNQKKNTDHV